MSDNLAGCNRVPYDTLVIATGARHSYIQADRLAAVGPRAHRRTAMAENAPTSWFPDAETIIAARCAYTSPTEWER